MSNVSEALRLAGEIERLGSEAFSVLSRYLIETPLIRAPELDAYIGCRVHLKLENMQLTGSFKIRGALFKTHRLFEKGCRGVVTASSGNHAIGVAYASKLLGLDALIVMPSSASKFKINKVREYGANIVLHGKFLDEAHAKALEIADKLKYSYVHTYDDIEVIAGQSTIMIEILEIIDNPGTVIAPIGGGGLISGLSVYAKKRGARVIGVQAENAPSMYMWFKEKRIPETIKPTIADGVYVRKPGDLTKSIVEEFVDDIVLVNEDYIVEAMKIMMSKLKIIVEGAAALPLAALLSGDVKDVKEPVILIVTGGNIDLDVLMRIIGLIH